MFLERSKPFYQAVIRQCDFTKKNIICKVFTKIYGAIYGA